ncbi:lysozyme [Billgrantia antri]|uniref:Lysozyme n=1 Tax=Halomonas sulfidivorans TaxID=2733488 RepID=A0ABX7WJA0_9GAMM|nr:N-acetylmuramoyl-L-alanine amidase [Halomonas sulfidivorans]QTP59572.1 lysozyme [Halomonas sulfidivorans]
MNHIKYFTIHASATYPAMDIDIEWIRDVHVNQKGWRDVGYHYFIKRDGTVQKGRPDNVQGAHVGRHNKNNIGICLAGGLKTGTKEPEDNFTAAQYIALTNLITKLKETHPDAHIMGHNGFSGYLSRGCPCFDWRAYRDYIELSLACEYRPDWWRTHDWKRGVPEDWLKPQNWYEAVLKQ